MRPSMGENVYTQVLNILDLVFEELAKENQATTDSEKAIVERNKMDCIFAFRRYYRTAKYDLTIHRG